MSKPVKPNTLPPKERNELSGLGVVLSRAMFYRDGFRNMIKITTIQSASILVCLCVIATLSYFLIKKEKIYFGMSPNGVLTRLVPLSEPSVPDSKMLQIAGDAATCVFTYDYVNYRKQLSACEPNFTVNGWMRFVTELDSSKMLKLVKTEELVLSATRLDAPVIEDRGLIDGVMAWKVAVPVRVTYSGRQNKTTEDYLVNMTVARVDQTSNSDGVAISSFIATIYKEVK
ncbi:MAG: hypothetical protein CTY35_00135 [Methylotenera sp.]|uniref:DotI/IcmL family type IV secretion protein n=1 Tax=Methylotenera sp. TaxID=2051956 RepID=UPI000D44EF00|nr:DotI/IcmL family type IV secretion protein [Methylotenera sp.]PPC84764.1 MAG: hypothetical protein CTY38_00135 [Methylotenera sp.]PPD02123.1 MAG: hypothetical protein CTY35_00135 [Methylotenera sp.]